MATADTVHDREQTPTASLSKSSPDERRVTAWIGQGVMVEGKITSAQDLRIDGKVDGEIKVGDHGLIIGAGAAIKANLVARSIVISGAVNGNVTATERIDVHPTASVAGDIHSPRLVVAEGAVITGKVDVGSNRRPKAQGS
jgi:cytoskeletal protein CcmA (bactofilin family)